MVRVLMVCTGNICRSPTAEGVLRSLLEERGLSDRVEVGSSGMIAYHVGEPPDPRSIQTAAARGVDISGQRARQTRGRDFEDFDYLLAMDRGHLEQLREIEPAGGDHTLALFLSYLDEPGTLDVPDPYYGGPDGFEHTYDLIARGAAAFLDHLEGSDRLS